MGNNGGFYSGKVYQYESVKLCNKCVQESCIPKQIVVWHMQFTSQTIIFDLLNWVYHCVLHQRVLVVFLYSILPLWQLFMNKNAGYDIAVTPSIGAVIAHYNSLENSFTILESNRLNQWMRRNSAVTLRCEINMQMSCIQHVILRTGIPHIITGMYFRFMYAMILGHSKTHLWHPYLRGYLYFVVVYIILSINLHLLKKFYWHRKYIYYVWQTNIFSTRVNGLSFAAPS